MQFKSRQTNFELLLHKYTTVLKLHNTNFSLLLLKDQLSQLDGKNPGFANISLTTYQRFPKTICNASFNTIKPISLFADTNEVKTIRKVVI